MKMKDINEQYKANTRQGWFIMDVPGSYRVRVVSELYPIKKAPFKPGDKPRTVFLCRVIDRSNETHSVKLWEMGYSIKDQYSTLSQDNDYMFDDFPNYDLKIQKISTGPEKQNVKYLLTPAPVSPLSQADLDMITNADDLTTIAAKIQKGESEKMLTPGTTGNNEIVDVDSIPF